MDESVRHKSLSEKNLEIQRYHDSFEQLQRQYSSHNSLKDYDHSSEIFNNQIFEILLFNVIGKQKLLRRKQLKIDWFSPLIEDPLESKDISRENMELTRKLLDRLLSYKDSLVHSVSSKSNPKRADPKLFNGIWSPGWCH